MTDLFDLPPQGRQEPVKRPVSAYAFPHPRPATPRLLTDGERACACGLAATCAIGPSTYCPWCAAPLGFFGAGREA